MRLVTLLGVAPLFLAAAAYAQAPGDYYAQPPPAVAPPPPPAANPCGGGGCGDGAWSVMQSRFSIGINVGQATVSPQGSPDTKTDFAIGELALRYRLRPEWEAEITLGGGQEKLKNGDDGTNQLSSATISLRYRFRPEMEWNWYLLAGLGGTAVTPKDATDQQKNDAMRGHVQFGIGVEHRWTHFALHAELRGTAIGSPKGADMTAAPTLNGDTKPVDTSTMPTDNLSAGQLTIGASYYF